MADVHDLRALAPDKGARYLLDTNVAIMLVQGVMAKQPSQKDLVEAEPYEQFLRLAKGRACDIVLSPLSLSEFSAHVERVHKDAYKRATGNDPSKNNYRALPAERAKVVKDIELGWRHALSFASVARLELSGADADVALKLIVENGVDAYDAFIVAIMKQNDLSYIVSHDRDFINVPNIILYTALKV